MAASAYKPIPPDADTDPVLPSGSRWGERYGRKHHLQRVHAFPAGVAAPKKVRLYARQDHFIVQWWDSAAKRTLSVRISGDLIDALAEARKIEARLVNYKTAGRGVRKLGHVELVDRFLADLHRRADAGELAATTVERYDTALRHYGRFCDRPEIMKSHPTAGSVNREFRLSFAAHLATGSHRHGELIASNSTTFGPVFDAVRAMFNWAAEPAKIAASSASGCPQESQPFGPGRGPIATAPRRDPVGGHKGGAEQSVRFDEVAAKIAINSRTRKIARVGLVPYMNLGRGAVCRDGERD